MRIFNRTERQRIGAMTTAHGDAKGTTGVSFNAIDSQQTFQLQHAGLGHLPLVIVRAVSVGRTFLLFPFQVDTKIFNRIIGLVSRAMIHAFVGTKRTAEVLRHHPAMFQDELHLPAHRIEHRPLFQRNSAARQHDMARVDDASGSAFFHLRSFGRRARPFLTTRFTPTRILGVLHLVSQHAEGEPANLAAIRARYRSGDAVVAVEHHRPCTRHVNSRMSAG